MPQPLEKTLADLQTALKAMLESVSEIQTAWDAMPTGNAITQAQWDEWTAKMRMALYMAQVHKATGK
jgi:hypothetical protein